MRRFSNAVPSVASEVLSGASVEPVTVTLSVSSPASS